MLTEDTKNAILIMESVDPARKEALEAAIAELSGWVSQFLGGQTASVILTKDKPEVEW